MEGSKGLHEIKNLREAQKRQRLLYQIISQSGKDLNEQLNNALKLTSQLLEMEIGIISKIVDDTYIIQNYYSADDELEEGQKFNIGETYCSITLENEHTVSIDHMEVSPWKRHPCYEYFHLESYIGTPIVVDDTIFGTLNFSSAKPKKNGFIPSDRNLIQLLAQWVGGIINRKLYKEELRKQKDLYQLIATNSAEMICLHDLDGTYRFVSPSVKTLLGYEPEELIGRNPYDFFHPEDQEKIQSESHQKALKNDPTKNFDYRIRNKNGNYVWFDTATEPVLNDDGEVVSLQTTSREITEKKKIEILFSESQKMAKVGGWEYDLDSGDLTWTDEVYRIHEVPLGTPVKVEDGISFYPDDAKQLIQDKINQAVQLEEPYDIELPFITAKGNHRWVRAIGRAEFNDGKATKLIGTFQDITDRKTYEKKIENQNKQLENLTETRDKLYSIIAHDLKGTFFGISGVLSITKEELKDYPDLDPTILRQIALAESSSNNAHQLFENLLDWTRIQSDALTVKKTEFDLKKEVESVFDLLQPSAKFKKVTLKKHFDSNITLSADRSMISTVLRNLISNAIKFSKESGTVEVKATSTKSETRLTVTDYGIGMPDEVKVHLFSSEKRPKRKGTKNEKGTGLGLLLAKDMIELHNGKIKVESEEGAGSMFTIILPK